MRKHMFGIIAALGLATLLTGCDIQASAPSARTQNVAAQSSTMDRATAAVPVPKINNFLSREAVAKQVKRLDEKNKLFYVYVLADNGQQLGYYVSNTRPVSTCSLLTPPDDVWKKDYGSGITSQRLSAPGLGGTYSGDGSCRSVFFFDAASDAYIEINGLNYFVSDQPLGIKAEPIKVQAVTAK